MKNSQQEPTPQESTEQQQLPQETTHEQQFPHESTLPTHHDLETIVYQCDATTIFLGQPDTVNSQFLNDSHVQAKSDIPISPKWVMASNDPFCADTSSEGISDQNNGSSTFWDLYSFLDQTYGSKWPTPSDIPILPEPGMNWYDSILEQRHDSNLAAQLDTPICSESEMDANNVLIADSDNPNRVKWLIDTEVKKSQDDEVDATDDDAVAAAKAISDAERLAHDKMIPELVAALKELDKERFLIQKILTKSDVSSNSLILPKDSVTEHILPFLRADQRKALIESSKGLTLIVYDEDEELAFEMRFKRGGSYMLVDTWMDKFVKRRGLKEGDTIGMYLVPSDNSIPRLRFSVLDQPRIELVSVSVSGSHTFGSE